MSEPYIFLSARNKSTRLKNKQLLRLSCGLTTTEFLLRRLKATGLKVVFTTSWEPDDEVFDSLCSKYNTPIFHGHPIDKLVRYQAAMEKFERDKAIIVDGDDILVSLEAIEKTRKALQDGYNYTYFEDVPDGLYCYGFTLNALDKIVLDKQVEDTEIWGTLFKNKFKEKVLNLD